MDAVLVAEVPNPPHAALLDDLRRSGFDVVEAETLAGTVAQLVQRRFDVVVLDAEIGAHADRDVPACLEMIGTEVPVILVSAGACLTDRIHALDAGAVDVVTKPYSPRELAARVRARVRFVREANAMRLRAGALDVDLINRSVTVAGEPVPLSNTEYRLLVYFLQNAGVACGRREIVSAIWGEDARVDGNLVEVYVGYLRRKLGREGAPFPLVTVRNVGYRFESPAPARRQTGGARASRPQPVEVA